jgi:hypothetical protein
VPRSALFSGFAGRINFQPAASAVPPSYLVDGGAVFGLRASGERYGWNAGNAAQARDRDLASSPDQRYDTLTHLQKPGNPNASWEIMVPNGTYTVRVVAGDSGYLATAAAGRGAAPERPLARSSRESCAPTGTSRTRTVACSVVLIVGSLEFVGRFEEQGWKLAGAIVPITYIAWSLWLILSGSYFWSGRRRGNPGSRKQTATWEIVATRFHDRSAPGWNRTSARGLGNRCSIH